MRLLPAPFALVLALCCGLLRSTCSGFTIQQSANGGQIHNMEDQSTTVRSGSSPATQSAAFYELEQALTTLELSPEKKRQAIDACVRVGWENTAELLAFARDFESQPETLGRILIGDFGMPPLQAHALRSGLTHLLKGKTQELLELQGMQGVQELQRVQGLQGVVKGSVGAALLVGDAPLAIADAVEVAVVEGVRRVTGIKSHYKKLVVNVKSKNRHAAGQTTYSLSTMVVETTVGSGSVGSVGTLRGSPVFEELKDFERFMTQPGASAQELPIRHSTAQVYMRHADLFLGWFAALATAPAPPAPAPAPALTPAPASALAPAPRQMHRVASATSVPMLDAAAAFTTSVPKLGAASTAAAVRAAAVEAVGAGALSLRTVFPCKERASAAAVYEYVQWLRGVRKISTSYEANVLRGLTKLAKFRFSQESLTDPSYGQKSFEDIPLVRELRKLHSDANRRQLNSPRVSNEQLKWMTWTDYLQVVGALRDDLQAELRGAQEAQGAKAGAGAKKTKGTKEMKGTKRRGKSMGRRDDVEEEEAEGEGEGEVGPGVAGTGSPGQVGDRAASLPAAVRLRVARAYQRYLLLAFFSCVPDRQRTFRELEIGRTFLQVEGQYLIQHGPEDYKTGNVYGERPPLMISKELTAAVDDFILNWREALAPTGPHLFVQARTGRALTADSVYALVSRACYEFAGKRTNPHLLRDIVVTHVRSTQASERELEALALYMGHSIGMQRSSYDRRTLPQKVAPAVLLLDSISRAPYNAQSLDISL